MRAKKLAEMIKLLRKQKLDEYQVRSGPTSKQLTKTMRGRNSAIDSRNQPKAGNDTRGRYHPHIKTESKDEEVTNTTTKSKKNKDVINTSPEQDSAMIGTQ